KSSTRSTPEDELPGRPVEPVIHTPAHYIPRELSGRRNECTGSIGINRGERQAAEVVMQVFDLGRPGSDAVFQANACSPAPQRLGTGSCGPDRGAVCGKTCLGATIGKPPGCVNHQIVLNGIPGADPGGAEPWQLLLPGIGGTASGDDRLGMPNIGEGEVGISAQHKPVDLPVRSILHAAYKTAWVSRDSGRNRSQGIGASRQCHGVAAPAIAEVAAHEES